MFFVVLCDKMIISTASKSRYSYKTIPVLAEIHLILLHKKYENYFKKFNAPAREIKIKRMTAGNYFFFISNGN